MKARYSPAAMAAKVILMLSCTVLLAEPVKGGTLEGIVVGAAQNPKTYLRVEINGPESRIAFTDNDGKFSVTLKGGRYTIHVIETPRRMQFITDVPSDNSIKKETFSLAW